MEDQNVLLTNGARVPKSVVDVTMISLSHLMTKGGFAGIIQAYDLAMFCRDSSYHMSEANKKALQDLGLLEGNGSPHDIVKDIVLSALQGEGLGMRLVQPIADQQ